MVDKVYIVWCKLNKSTDKFDLGVFIDKKKADNTMGAAQIFGGKVWVQEYKLSWGLTLWIQ